jgi:hypothetical protein|tara:strand:- start:310 stop:522 length:213 start_codon:yes stop_codon:yes gene_type:complete
MNKSITNALNKKIVSPVIYDDHYLGVIAKMRADIEIGAVSPRIALAKATTSGIGVNQIADLHANFERMYG